MKNLVIIDIKSNNFKDLDELLVNINTNTIVLALSPSSFFYLDYINKKYLTFHDLVSIEEFRNKILHFYEELLNLTYKNSIYKVIFREIVQSINYLLYIDIIVSFIKNNNFSDIKYITDKKCDNRVVINNNISLLSKYIDMKNIFIISQNNNRKISIKNYFKKYQLNSLIKKVQSKLLQYSLNYDWFYIISKRINKKVFIIDANDIIFSTDIINFESIENQNLIFNIKRNKITFINYVSFLTKEQQVKVVEYKQLGNKLYFYQHGSYFYHYYFKSSCRFNLELYEIDSADINFVFNDYTKKLFENLGAKKVFSVGSMLFNKPIKERKKEYDFLYITQGHDYLGNLQYVDFPNSLHSFDGYELYQRHKSIIELFGTKFKDKKIIIRVHPTVLTNGVYVPFWELAESYTNITVDASIPIHTLIEKSNFIISDYYTSEFINRELHYKRDILLFQGAPTPIPEETVDDMNKMFILVETVDDLEEKVKNIEIITKDRPRYDDIIEYYSSKKCDTKKVVTEILEKELNARNNS